jgi:AraC-like DNA-binding protein
MAAPLREAGLVDDGVLARLVAQGQAAIATLPAGPAPDAPVDFRIRRVVAELRRTPNRAVAELAQLAGLCLPHFFHRFRACTGLTPRGFANAIRLERALDGVADTAMPLAALSRQLGFTHQSHFTRFFRSRVGFSPRAYRACAGSGRRLSGDARHVA